MKNFSTKALLFAVLLGTQTMTLFSQTVSWYNGQTLETYTVLNDVYAYKQSETQTVSPETVNLAAMAAVESISYDSIGKFKMTRLRPAATNDEKSAFKNYIRSTATYQEEYTALVKDPANPKDVRYLGDIISVIFKNPTISGSAIQDFATKYNLITIYTSETGLSQFKVNRSLISGEIGASATIARSIFLNEPSTVSNAEPDIINAYRPHSIETIACSKNDLLFKKAWHIGNDGTFNWTYKGITTNGVVGADAKLCECWNAGYSGQNINIAVIDFFGFEWTHEDLVGQFINGADVRIDLNTPITGTIITDPKAVPHGTMVSSIVNAIADNGKGMTGTAYSSKVIPLLISGQESQIQRALDWLIKNKIADVVNMSFGGPSKSGTTESRINLLIAEGRPDKFNPGINHGIVFVASAGNDNQQIVQYPGAYDNVIGVIGSTPDDKRFRDGDGFGTPVNNGSNFDFAYDIAAPGALVSVADLMGAAGISPDNYVIQSGTSISSPIVAGIAAIMLSKNPSLSAKQIKNAITSTADKVNPDIYNYNGNPSFPGQSLEMSNGRINCKNAINSIPVGIAEVKELENLIMYSKDKDHLVIRNNASYNNLKISIYNLIGQERYTTIFTNDNMEIDLSDLSQGMYLVNFATAQGNMQTKKIIKY